MRNGTATRDTVAVAATAANATAGLKSCLQLNDGLLPALEWAAGSVAAGRANGDMRELMQATQFAQRACAGMVAGAEMPRENGGSSRWPESRTPSSPPPFHGSTPGERIRPTTAQGGAPRPPAGGTKPERRRVADPGRRPPDLAGRCLPPPVTAGHVGGEVEGGGERGVKETRTGPLWGSRRRHGTTATAVGEGQRGGGSWVAAPSPPESPVGRALEGQGTGDDRVDKSFDCQRSRFRSEWEAY